MKCSFLMKAPALAASVLMMTALFAACDSVDDPVAGPDPVIDPIDSTTLVAQDNEIFIQYAKAADFKSVFFEQFANYKLVVASPVEGFSSWHDVVDNNQPYVMAMVTDELAGRDIDIYSGVEVYSFISTLPELGADMFSFNSEDSSLVKSGVINFTIDADNNATFTAHFTMANDSAVSIALNGLFKEPVASNVIGINGDEQVIVSSFFDTTEPGATSLYFTPQDIAEGEDVPNAKQYVWLRVEDAMLGQTVDITTETGSFMYASFDNYQAEKDIFYVTTGMTNDATGTITVTPKETEGEYTVDVNLTSATGVPYTLHYEGQCAPYYVEPENALTIQGSEVKPLYSAVVDQTADVWTVYLSTEAGIKTVADMKDSDYLSFTLPGASADGEAHGFSTDASLSIYYNKQTYGLGAEGHRGTIQCSVDGDEILVFVKEWTTPFEVNYHGTATFIK